MTEERKQLSERLLEDTAQILAKQLAQIREKQEQGKGKKDLEHDIQSLAIITEAYKAVRSYEKGNDNHVVSG